MSGEVTTVRTGYPTSSGAVDGSSTHSSRTLRLGRRARRDSTSRLVAGLLLWLGLLLVTYWWAADGGITDLGGWATGLMSAGRIAGLWSAQLLLVQVLQMARLPWLENAYGRDRLVRIHRVVGLTSFTLMVTHVVLIVGGYATGQWSAVLSTPGTC